MRAKGGSRCRRRKWASVGGEQRLPGTLQAKAQRVRLQRQPELADAEDEAVRAPADLNRWRVGSGHQHAIIGPRGDPDRQAEDISGIGNRRERSGLGRATHAARHPPARAELADRRQRRPVRILRIDRHRLVSPPPRQLARALASALRSRP